MSEENNELEGPEFEVWNHLWSGVDTAADELRVLDPNRREALESIAKTIFDARKVAVVSPDSFGAKLLEADQFLLQNRWLRHAVEIEIAKFGVARAEGTLKRYLRLRPLVAHNPIPPRATKYMAEVISTFAFGFDAACIALCRATVEQVLRDELITRGEYSEARLKREQPTAATLIANAKRCGMLNTSISAAEFVVTKGNTVMHKFLYDDSVIEQLALDSINHVLEVRGELLASGRPEGDS